MMEGAFLLRSSLAGARRSLTVLDGLQSPRCRRSVGKYGGGRCARRGLWGDGSSGGLTGLGSVNAWHQPLTSRWMPQWQRSVATVRVGYQWHRPGVTRRCRSKMSWCNGEHEERCERSVMPEWRGEWSRAGAVVGLIGEGVRRGRADWRSGRSKPGERECAWGAGVGARMRKVD